MVPALYISYSDLFDRQPTMVEIIDLVKNLPLRHAVDALSRLNLALRYSMQEHGRVNLAKIQGMLLAGYSDNEVFGLLKARFPTAKCDERPVFSPHCVLTVLRVVITYCDPERSPHPNEDESVRYSVGRACLMMNNLLFTPEQGQALQVGTDDGKRIELMVQTMALFELVNSPKADHLMPRLQIMYRLLLKDDGVKSRIALKCENFDFEREFNDLVGMSLERWLFVVFAIYAYFLTGANPLDPKPEYMLLNPRVFRGDSGITQPELDTVLKTLAIPAQELKSAILSEKSTDPRYDFTSFRSKPLFIVEEGKLLPTDLAFILEKCHAGVQWTMNDLLPTKKRQTVFNAWGVLFEEYVHWLFEGMQTDLPLTYLRSPKWRGTVNESFDGLLLQGDVLMPAEYKGGFLARDARYSGNVPIFLGELNKKFTPGCDQLADKIAKLFTADSAVRKELEGVALDTIRSVVPALVLQDHIFRVPFLNWYFNRHFQDRLARHALRSGVVVRPLTVLNIHDLESIIHSAEGDNFDFIYALHHRTVRDELVLSDLLDVLRQFPNFGKKPSPRLKGNLDNVQKDFSSYLFPNGDTSAET